jgi:integrase
MAGTVKHKRLESPTARSRLKPGRQPHWQALVEGKVHLGYQRHRGDEQGRWLIRRYVGNRRYQLEAIGRADDATTEADGVRVLSYVQAYDKAAAMVSLPAGKKEQLTVADVWGNYLEAKRDKGQLLDSAVSAGRVYILPPLGDLIVDRLDIKQLRKWHATVAHTPARLRSVKGKLVHKPEPSTDEEKRARKVSANRVLTYLKAALNHAYKEGDVKNRDAWDIKLEPFAKVDAPRERYLNVDEARRLINACTPDFRPLVQAALESGCRYGELTRMRVHDFHADSGTLHVHVSKSGKSRDVVLSAAGADFFRRHCLGRAGHDWMFVHRDGTPWGKSDQCEPMHNAVERARISPPISFHGLRHTWASLAVMNHMPLMVVAKNLGHRDTRMVEHHYGHLAKSFVADAIRAHAPVYGVVHELTAVPLPTRRGSN